MLLATMDPMPATPATTPAVSQRRDARGSEVRISELVDEAIVLVTGFSCAREVRRGCCRGLTF